MCLFFQSFYRNYPVCDVFFLYFSTAFVQINVEMNLKLKSKSVFSSSLVHWYEFLFHTQIDGSRNVVNVHIHTYQERETQSDNIHNAYAYAHTRSVNVIQFVRFEKFCLMCSSISTFFHFVFHQIQPIFILLCSNGRKLS